MEQVYRACKPKVSPLWQCLSRHFNAFLTGYEEHYQLRYGFLRPIIPEVVNKFLDCGDLARGFARVRCDHCTHEYLLAFSCKGRWFCPSCHQKQVQLFGALLTETILFPVPHRHFTLGIPKMLRTYFRFNRDLLKDFCRLAHEGLGEYMQTTLGLPDGLPGIVMAIHTFGEYMDTSIPTCTRWWPTACSTSYPKSASSRWRSCSGRGSSRFWPKRACCRPPAPRCCGLGNTPGSTCIAAAASCLTSAQIWSGLPSTLSAARLPPRRCKSTAEKLGQTLLS